MVYSDPLRKERENQEEDASPIPSQVATIILLTRGVCLQILYIPPFRKAKSLDVQVQPRTFRGASSCDELFSNLILCPRSL